MKYFKILLNCWTDCKCSQDEKLKYRFNTQGSQLSLYHSKSYVVGGCIYNGKDEHPCIVTIKMLTMNIFTLLP